MKTLLFALVLLAWCACAAHAGQPVEPPGPPPAPAQAGADPLPPPPVVAEEEGAPPPPQLPPFERGGRRGPRGQHPVFERGVERAMDWMRQERPEQFHELVRLRRENPPEFRERVRGVMREYFKQKHPDMYAHFKQQREQEEQLRTLAEKYRASTNAEERVAIQSEMRGLLEQSFAQRQQARMAELKKLEERLEEFRETLKAREDNKAELIEMRLKGLIEGDATVKW